jgi:hypothetical protein
VNIHAYAALTYTLHTQHAHTSSSEDPVEQDFDLIGMRMCMCVCVGECVFLPIFSPYTAPYHLLIYYITPPHYTIIPHYTPHCTSHHTSHHHTTLHHSHTPTLHPTPSYHTTPHTTHTYAYHTTPLPHPHTTHTYVHHTTTSPHFTPQLFLTSRPRVRSTHASRTKR